MRNQYSFSEFIKTVYSLLITRVIIPQARLIRRPVYIRGLHAIEGANGLTTGRFCRFDLGKNKKTLFIGESCEFGDMTHIVALERVCIGKNCLLASKVFISDTSHGVYHFANEISQPDISPNERILYTKAVTIGDNVWIGENVCILAGSKIGNGCIIGANSVITKEIPNNCIVVGNNQIIKCYNYQTHRWERLGYCENIADLC